jgi:hypothetical protein
MQLFQGNGALKSKPWTLAIGFPFAWAADILETTHATWHAVLCQKKCAAVALA